MSNTELVPPKKLNEDYDLLIEDISIEDQTEEIYQKPKIFRNIFAVASIGLSLVHVQNPQRSEMYSVLAGSNISKVFSEINPLDHEPNKNSYEFLEHEYAVGNGLFRDNSLGDYSNIWQHSQVLAAYNIISLDEEYSDQYDILFNKTLNATEAFWEDSDYLPGYNSSINEAPFGEKERFVDDNLWMGLILFEEYEQTGNSDYLDRSKQIFNLAMDQWDGNSGGIYWQVQWPGVSDHSKAMVSNAPAVQLGVMLYKETGEEWYLESSEEIFDWVLEHKDDQEGIFNDSVKGDGSHEFSKWTYVQGSIAGAMALLSEVNPEKYSMDDAVDLINISLDHLENDSIMGNNAFNAIFFRNALKIASLYDEPEFTENVEKALYDQIRQLSKPHDLLETAGMMQLIAMTKVSRSDYSKLF